MRGDVVVGVAGTQSSEAAVEWAADAAAARRTRLVLVHAVGVPVGGDALWDDAVGAAVGEMLTRQAEHVTTRHPTLDVTTAVDVETPGRVLTRLSETASLVVVGTRRTTPSRRVFSGSLAYQVVAGAHSAVAVVPPSTHELGDRVVVGADGSAVSAAATLAAAEEADRLGAVLEVVHAWEEPAFVVSVGLVPSAMSTTAAQEEAVVLGEAVAGLASSFPGLVVERSLVRSDPASALLAAADRARLLVVGTHGRGGVARMLLGSVSHAVILHATCPVLVVRPS